MNFEQMNKMREEMNTMKTNYESAMKTFGKMIFKEATEEIFSKNPKLKSFTWNQFTPYFNDGDTCEFNVYRDTYLINGSDDYLDTWNAGNWLEESYEYKPDPKEYGLETVQEVHDIALGLDKVMNLFTDDDLKSLFGDHTSVTVNRDGTIVTDDYDHV